MPAYVRKVKSKSGATSVQIEYKHGRKRTGITHIGTAHNDSDIKSLSAIALGEIHKNQSSFNFAGQDNTFKPKLRKSYSAVLWDALDSVYTRLGFEVTVWKKLFACPNRT